jgi:hypothetical protein
LYGAGSASIRAGIEPLSGLNRFCPLADPHSISHFLASVSLREPVGRVNESERKSKIPSVPGDGTTLKSCSQTSFLVMAR